jgi:hypothetical protein
MAEKKKIHGRTLGKKVTWLYNQKTMWLGIKSFPVALKSRGYHVSNSFLAFSKNSLEIPEFSG